MTEKATAWLVLEAACWCPKVLMRKQRLPIFQHQTFMCFHAIQNQWILMDCNIPSPTNWGAEGLQNPGKCSPGTSISLKLGSNQFAKQICKAKKSLAFEVLKSVEYHRRCDLAAEICYGSSEADLRKTSQPGSAEAPSRHQKPGARCSSTAATWDSKSTQLSRVSLTHNW